MRSKQLQDHANASAADGLWNKRKVAPYCDVSVFTVDQWFPNELAPGT
jgi:hypothetical protein